jgi:hypothetical protein
VRLVDDEAREEARLEEALEGGTHARAPGHLFRRDEEHAELAARRALERRRLRGAAAAVGARERSGRDARGAEAHDLVLDQRVERRDDDRQPARLDGSRELVDERLAAAGAHQHEDVLARHRRVEGAALDAAEAAVPEARGERGGRGGVPEEGRAPRGVVVRADAAPLGRGLELGVGNKGILLVGDELALVVVVRLEVLDERRLHVRRRRRGGGGGGGGGRARDRGRGRGAGARVVGVGGAGAANKGRLRGARDLVRRAGQHARQPAKRGRRGGAPRARVARPRGCGGADRALRGCGGPEVPVRGAGGRRCDQGPRTRGAAAGEIARGTIGIP